MTEKQNVLDNRLRTAVAIAIATTSVVGAVIAGSAAQLGSKAGDTQREGFIADVNYRRTDMVARTSLYRELRALVDRQQYSALAEALEADAADAEANGDTAAAETLRAQAQEHRASADAAGWFVSPDYLTDDGDYDQDLFMQDQFSYAAQDRDIDSANEYARAANFRSRSEGLVVSLIGLSFAVLLFTIAEQTAPRWRALFFAMGMAVLACGLCAAVAGDLIRAWLAGV